MAQPNAQTQAIIDRLKEEGLLVRNKGTNSIKSVKDTLITELGKFQGTFDAIRQSMGYMDQAAADQAEIAKRNADLAALSEDDRNAVLKTIAENAAKQANLDERELALRNKELMKKEKTDIKLLGKNGLIGSALTKIKDFAVNAAAIGLFGAAAYEFIAGFIESQFGIELPTVAEIFRGVYNALKDVDWMKLKENLSFLADPDFLKKAGIALAVGSSAAVLVDVAENALLYKLLYQVLTGRGLPIPPTTTTPPGSPPGKTPKLGGIKGALLSSLALAGVIYAEDIADFIRGSVTDLTPEEIANTPIGGLEAGISAAGGAAAGFLTLGAFIGAWPALVVGALAGTVWAAGSAILENVNKREADLKSSGLGPAAFNALKAEADKAAGNRMRFVPNVIGALEKDIQMFNDEISELENKLKEGSGEKIKGRFVEYTESQRAAFEEQLEDTLTRRANSEKLLNERINAEIERGNVNYIPQDAFNQRIKELRELQNAEPNATMERGGRGTAASRKELIKVFEIDGVKYTPEQLEEKIKELEKTYKSRFGQQEFDRISDLGRVLQDPAVAAQIVAAAATAATVIAGNGGPPLAYTGGPTIINNNMSASTTKGGNSFTSLLMNGMGGGSNLSIPNQVA
jgi:hypothetical protein